MYKTQVPSFSKGNVKAEKRSVKGNKNYHNIESLPSEHQLSKPGPFSTGKQAPTGGAKTEIWNIISDVKVIVVDIFTVSSNTSIEEFNRDCTRGWKQTKRGIFHPVGSQPI